MSKFEFSWIDPNDDGDGDRVGEDDHGDNLDNAP